MPSVKEIDNNIWYKRSQTRHISGIIKRMELYPDEYIMKDHPNYYQEKLIQLKDRLEYLNSLEDGEDIFQRYSLKD